MSIIPNVKNIHALFYEDLMTVERNVVEADEYGIVGNRKKRVIVFENIKCKVSMYRLSREDSPKDDEMYYRNTEVIVKVFLDPDIEILPGDWITTYRHGKLFYDGIANKSNVHMNQQELLVYEIQGN